MAFKFVHEKTTIKFEFPDPNDFLSQQIIQHEAFYERRYLNFIQKYRRKLIKYQIGVVIDVGSHIGNHSIFFSKILGCKVFSFEPQPKIYKSLCKNIQINHVAHLVTPRNIAISANKKDLHVIKRYDNMCGSTQWWYNDKEDKETQKIQSFPLDSLFKRRVDFIKIDVEGMEMEVLSGARNLIQRDYPIIMIEITDIDGKGHFPNKKKFENWIRRFNYERIGTKHFNRNTYLLARRGLLKLPPEEENIEEELIND